MIKRKSYRLGRPFDGLTAGTAINKMVSESEELGQTLSGKIYPALALQNTQTPFLVYDRTGVTPRYGKDGRTGDEVTMDLTVVDDDYEDCMDLACRLRDLIEWTAWPELSISCIQVTGASEDYSQSGYAQTLNVKILFS